MAMRQNIQWPRIFAEGTAIVVSILLAFAIDTWWQERKEAETQHAQLQTLLGEFKAARDHLVLQLGALQGSLNGTLNILRLSGPGATEAATADFRAAVSESLNVGVSAPRQGALEDMLATRAGINYGRYDLWSNLQTWSMLMSDLEVDAQHLESSREVNFIDALVRLGVPLLEIIQAQPNESQADSRLRLPASHFDADLSVLLRDPGVETVFTMRAIQSQLLIQQHQYAIKIADDIIANLENEI
jgi:hypothetical protein